MDFFPPRRSHPPPIRSSRHHRPWRSRQCLPDGQGNNLRILNGCSNMFQLIDINWRYQLIFFFVIFIIDIFFWGGGVCQDFRNKTWKCSIVCKQICFPTSQRNPFRSPSAGPCRPGSANGWSAWVSWCLAGWSHSSQYGTSEWIDLMLQAFGVANDFFNALGT